jgi:hypothetical protein
MIATTKRWLMALLLAFSLGGLLAYTAAPAQAAYNWSPSYNKTDCSGNGCLTITYRIRQGYSIGFYLEGVKISAENPANLAGINGKGLSCWGELGNIQFSKDGTQTNLNPGGAKFWDTEVSMPNSDRLACSWFWEENYYIGGSINQCAKVLVKHSDYSLGGCG